jgi:hypothetical protein
MYEKYGRAIVALGLILGFSTAAFGQAVDTPFQVRFATKLKKNDAIHIVNTGANGASFSTPQTGTTCAYVYAFAPSGSMLDCCSCALRPNSMASLSIAQDVLGGRKPLPKEVVLKVLSTRGTGTNPIVCNAAAAGVEAIAIGMVSWKGEAQFAPATLSAGELSVLTSTCQFLHMTANVCAACRPPAE